jgi:hypothetical protein
MEEEMQYDMNPRRWIADLGRSALICASLLGASSTAALGEDAITAPAQKTIGSPKTEMVPSLAVLNSRGASLDNGKLTMSGVSANSIIFADRPVRAAGHVLTAHFIKQWDEGNDSFSKDPPNATISVLSSDGLSVKDAVVVLKAPKLEGDQLTFEVAVLEGDLAGADGPASLFIDWFAAGGYGRGVGVWHGGGYGWHAPVYRGAWYGAAGLAAGAAIGAAAAAPYYHPYYPPPPPPACGYYPYPPCY